MKCQQSMQASLTLYMPSHECCFVSGFNVSVGPSQHYPCLRHMHAQTRFWCVLHTVQQIIAHLA